jgi:hypothetical protein
MQHTPTCLRCRPEWVLIVVTVLLMSGCNAQEPPAYEDKQGFHFKPPPGWVERARDNAMPSHSDHKQQNVPLPPLGVAGRSGQERLLVRYDRLTAGNLAWLRLTVADLSSSSPLQASLSTRAPWMDWKRETEVESLELRGRSAARVAWQGRWSDQDYINETVAIRQGEQVYLITASFPASDTTAREQVRQAVAGATWR